MAHCKLATIALLALIPSTALAAEKAAPKTYPVYPPVVGKDLDALRDKLEKGVKPLDDKDKAVQAGQPLAPGQKDVKAVEAAPPPPPPMQPPIATVMASTSTTPPKGWAPCDKTHAADFCKQLLASAPAPKGQSYIVKLPEDGSMDKLNAFIDAAAAERAAREHP